MQNDNKMEWWFSFVSVLIVITAIITLCFSVTAFMIAGGASKSAQNAAASIEEVAREISITVRSEPVVITQPDTSGKGNSAGETETVASGSDLSNDPDTAVHETVSYILREYNGKLGVFSVDGGLLKTVSVMVASLPEADRRALNEGICVASYAELTALLEDFS